MTDVSGSPRRRARLTACNAAPAAPCFSFRMTHMPLGRTGAWIGSAGGRSHPLNKLYTPPATAPAAASGEPETWCVRARASPGVTRPPPSRPRSRGPQSPGCPHKARRRRGGMRPGGGTRRTPGTAPPRGPRRPRARRPPAVVWASGRAGAQAGPPAWAPAGRASQPARGGLRAVSACSPVRLRCMRCVPMTTAPNHQDDDGGDK